MNRLIIATLLIVSLVGPAAASPADLTIFPKESSTRIDSFTSYEITVENVGPVKDVYEFTSSNPQEVSIAPSKVSLEPGAEEEVHVWYNPEINKEEGTYSFSVTATSRATGKDYSVDGIVNVIKEHKVALEMDTSKTGCVSGKTIYEVEVTNNGIQKEEFEVTTEYGELSSNKVTLEDGETQVLKLTVDSDEPVTETFNVVAASTTSYAQDIQPVTFTAETCYASDVSITPESQDVSAFNTAEYEVTVRNTGTKADDFVLSTSMGELSENEISIDGESSETVTLEARPETLGQKTVTVTAKSRVTSSASATMNVQNGMDAEVEFAANNIAMCEDQTATVEAKISNTGDADEKYSLETTRGSLSTNELVVEEGESEVVDIKLNGSSMKPESYQLDLTATATTFGEPVVEKTLNFKVENCWDLKMEVIPEVESVGENRSTVYEVRLTNPGTKTNTYELSYEGPEWISIKPGQVEVAPGTTEKAYIYAGIPFQKKGEVEITATAVGHDVRDSETVKLVIGKDIKDAIKSDEGSLTGAFSQQISGIMDGINANQVSKIVVSILVGLLLTAVVLYREW